MYRLLEHKNTMLERNAKQKAFMVHVDIIFGFGCCPKKTLEPNNDGIDYAE